MPAEPVGAQVEGQSDGSARPAGRRLLFQPRRESGQGLTSKPGNQPVLDSGDDLGNVEGQVFGHQVVEESEPATGRSFF